jgi:hypothetical protein
VSHFDKAALSDSESTTGSALVKGQEPYFPDARNTSLSGSSTTSTQEDFTNMYWVLDTEATAHAKDSYQMLQLITPEICHPQALQLTWTFDGHNFVHICRIST